MTDDPYEKQGWAELLFTKHGLPLSDLDRAWEETCEHQCGSVSDCSDCPLDEFFTHLVGYTKQKGDDPNGSDH